MSTLVSHEPPIHEAFWHAYKFRISPTQNAQSMSTLIRHEPPIHEAFWHAYKFTSYFDRIGEKCIQIKNAAWPGVKSLRAWLMSKANELGSKNMPPS